MGLPNQYLDAEGNRKPDAPRGTNQFIKGTRTRHDEATRDRMRAEHLARRMYAFAAQTPDEETGEEVVMDKDRIAAAKILIDKGKPSLQAVEQTNISETESKSPEEIESMVRALITANPELLARLNLTAKPVLAASSEGKEAEAA